MDASVSASASNSMDLVPPPAATVDMMPLAQQQPLQLQQSQQQQLQQQQQQEQAVIAAPFSYKQQQLQPQPQYQSPLPLAPSQHAVGMFAAAAGRPLATYFTQRMVGYPWSTPAQFWERFVVHQQAAGQGSGGASGADRKSLTSMMSLLQPPSTSLAVAFGTSASGAGAGAGAGTPGGGGGPGAFGAFGASFAAGLTGMYTRQLRPLYLPFLIHYKAKDQPPYFFAVCRFEAKTSLGGPATTHKPVAERKRAQSKTPSFYRTTEVVFLGPEVEVPILMHDNFIQQWKIPVEDRQLMMALWMSEAVPVKHKWPRESKMINYYWGKAGTIRATGNPNNVNNMLYVSGKPREPGSSTHVQVNGVDHQRFVLYKQSVQNLVVPAPDVLEPAVRTRALETLGKYGLLSAFNAAVEKADKINLETSSEPVKIKWPEKTLESKRAPGVVGIVGIKRFRNGKAKATGEADSEQSSDSDPFQDDDDDGMVGPAGAKKLKRRTPPHTPAKAKMSGARPDIVLGASGAGAGASASVNASGASPVPKRPQKRRRKEVVAVDATSKVKVADEQGQSQNDDDDDRYIPPSERSVAAAAAAAAPGVSS